MAVSKTALIIGASRGLGLGLVERLREQHWQVTATVRNAAGRQALAALDGVTVEALDMNDVQQIDTLAHALQGKTFDVIFVNAGVMGPVGDLATVDEQAMGALFITNVLSPLRVAKALQPNLRAHTGVLAFMSSWLGSVTCPDAAEVPLYKASKAALNSMVNSYYCQLAAPRPTLLSMHPGWVKTDMGGAGADIDVLTSTTGMVEQLNAYAGKGGHHFINYRGDVLPW